MDKAERRGAVRCRVILAVLLLLGVGLILGGRWGDRQFSEAGFTQENAFSVIYQLSDEAEQLYRHGILPALTDSGADSGPLEAAGASLLSGLWQDAGQAEAALQGANSARKMKLLAVTFAVSGPTVKATQRKQLAALSSEERNLLVSGVMQALSGQEASLPDPAPSLLEGLSGEARSAMLAQIFLTAANQNGRYITSDTVSE